MLLISSIILLIILFARVFEELFKIPYTLSIISIAYALNLAFPELFTVLAANSNEIVFLMLPLILLPDLLNLSIDEIRKHVWDFSYLALFSATAAISLAVWFSSWLLPEYQFSLIMLVTLYLILMATDAVTISSIFERFSLPEKLKIYAKGESLFNNILALIIFYFIARPILAGNEIEVLNFNQHAIEMVVFSVCTGFCVAFFGYLGLKVIKDPIDQFMILYLVCIISFVLAEFWDIVGILSLITAIISFKFFHERENILVQNKIKRAEFSDIAQCSKSYAQMVSNLIQHLPTVSRRGIRDYKKEAYYIGILANSLVFVCIANIVKIESLLLYAREIIVVFLLTSLIRYVFIQAFIFSHKLPKCWGNVLTLAGMKGGLTIIMVHTLPENFVYKTMFESIIVGVVILSTFVYALLNMFYLQFNQCEFQADIAEDSQPKTVKKIVKSILDIVAHDPVSKAYNHILFDELLEKEISRTQRYKLDMSLIILKVDSDNHSQKSVQQILLHFGDVVYQQMRDNDVFGKLSDNSYAIIGVNTKQEGAEILAQRISSSFYSHSSVIEQKIQLQIGLAILLKSDTAESIIERGKKSLAIPQPPGNETGKLLH